MIILKRSVNSITYNLNKKIRWFKKKIDFEILLRNHILLYNPKIQAQIIILKYIIKILNYPYISFIIRNLINYYKRRLPEVYELKVNSILRKSIEY